MNNETEITLPMLFIDVSTEWWDDDAFRDYAEIQREFREAVARARQKHHEHLADIKKDAIEQISHLQRDLMRRIRDAEDDRL